MVRRTTMKNIILSLVLILGSGFGYMTINEIVGKSIDAREAKYYRIFSDVPGFESARFCENGDSVLVEINVVLNDTHQVWYQNIDKNRYRSIVYYTEFFQKIIEDPFFRHRYTKEQTIGWPMFTKSEIDSVAEDLKIAKIMSTACCLSAAIPASAYTGGLIGREVVETVSGGCYTTNIYIIHPGPFWGITAAGTMAGCAFSMGAFSSDLKGALVVKDIVAFDQYGQPITVQDFENEEIFTSRTLNGIGGVIIGTILSARTGLIMVSAYDRYEPKTAWDSYATSIPIIAFSVSELVTFIKLSIEYGSKQDRKATIEKIKQKRIKEHLEKLKKTED